MFDEKFWLAIAFFTFLFLLKKLAWPKIAKALDSKSKEIAENLLAAKELKEKAEKLLIKAEKYLQESQNFSEKLLKDAEIEAQKFSHEAKLNLEAEITKKTNAALTRIKTEEESAIRELKNKIINSALEKAAESFAKDLKDEDHQKLSSKSLDEFAKTIN